MEAGAFAEIGYVALLENAGDTVVRPEQPIFIVPEGKSFAFMPRKARQGMAIVGDTLSRIIPPP